MFSALLKELREKAGLTQGRIAEILDTPVRTYGSWERGERQPDFDTLIKIADYYHVSTDYLLGHVPVPVTIKKEAPPAEPPEGSKRMVLDFGSSTTDQEDIKRLVVEIVKREFEKKGL